MSFKRGRSATLVHGSWSSAHTDPSQFARRTQQLLYFECDVYTINRTLLRAYEDFSEERAHQLFEKYSRKKVNRSVAHFLIDRISFQRKGAFGSKPFRKEVTYREIKYFFAWSARPEYFMFCVTDEKLRRRSYEIYRCDNTQDVHAICAFVYKATSDTQFILRNELPVDVISQSLNENDDSFQSQDETVGGNLTPRNDSFEEVNRTGRGSVSLERTGSRNSYVRDRPPLPEPRHSKVAEGARSSTRECLRSLSPVTRISMATANSLSKLPESRAVDVYSFYDISPHLGPRNNFARGSSNNGNNNNDNISEPINRTITIKRQEKTSTQKDFSAQSGVSLVSKATSPFLSTPGSLARKPPIQKVDTLTSPFENVRHSFISPNSTISTGTIGQSLATMQNFDHPVAKEFVHQQDKPAKPNERNILYASSESFFDQPLSSDGPLYMYVTYVESDSQFGGSSNLSRASTRAGTPRNYLGDESTEA